MKLQVSHFFTLEITHLAYFVLKQYVFKHMWRVNMFGSLQ
jgi:hypothetical protein